MADETAKPKLEVVPDLDDGIRRAFKDKGRLIDSSDHILVQKVGGRRKRGGSSNSESISTSTGGSDG
jgi:hypothetical protein